MWSRNPIPVLRVPAPVPSSARARRTSVSPVLRSIVAVRGAIRAVIVSYARLHRAGMPLEALGARERDPSARELGRGGVVDPDLGHRAAEVPPGEHRGNARS